MINPELDCHKNMLILTMVYTVFLSPEISLHRKFLILK
jgi:hypothetical protein